MIESSALSSSILLQTPKNSNGDERIALQIYLGLAWSTGCGAASVPVLTTARDCVIGKGEKRS